VQAAATDAEAAFNKYLDDNGHRPDVVQMRADEAPIRMLRGDIRWQIFLKMYFKGDLEAVTAYMQDVTERVPDGVRAELEVNPTNMF